MRRIRMFAIAVLVVTGISVMAWAANPAPPAEQKSVPMAATEPKGKAAQMLVGEITALDPGANTFSVKEAPVKGAEARTIDFSLSPNAKVTGADGGSGLANVKVGDAVKVKYHRDTDKLLADELTAMPGPPPKTPTR